MKIDFAANPETPGPVLSLDGAAAEQLMAGCKPGDTIDAQVTFKVGEIDPESGSAGLEAVSMEYAPHGASGPEETPEDEAGEAYDKFAASKKAPAMPMYQD
jgi:hypothetical protein